MDGHVSRAAPPGRGSPRACRRAAVAAASGLLGSRRSTPWCSRACGTLRCVFRRTRPSRVSPSCLRWREGSACSFREVPRAIFPCDTRREGRAGLPWQTAFPWRLTSYACGDAVAQCPECRTACPVHDHREREWRCLDACEPQTRSMPASPRPTAGRPERSLSKTSRIGLNGVFDRWSAAARIPKASNGG